MGGFGTWDVLARHPDLVAAAVPICGGGNPAKAGKMTGVPIWVFHGDKDEAVKVEQSRTMVEAVKKAGGDVKYTEYPGVGHNSWEKAYAEPELLKWMMSQKRKSK
jgi:predicted peptidase